MNPQRSALFFPLAVLALAVSCDEPAGPGRLSSDDVSSAYRADKGFLPNNAFRPNNGPLQVKAEVKVEEVSEQSIREHVEIRSFFTGIEPVDPNAQSPVVADIQLDFEIDTPFGEDVILGIVIAGDAWTALDGGDFVIESKGAQAVHDDVKVQVFEAGQAVADLTGHIAAVEARLRFRPGIRSYELIVQFTGIITPSMIVTPSMFNGLTGAASATLRIDQDQLTALIRESQAVFDVVIPSDIQLQPVE